MDSSNCKLIAEVAERELVKLRGRITAITLAPPDDTAALEARLTDASGSLNLVWLGQRSLAGVDIGSHLTAEGRVSLHGGGLAILNPRYELCGSRP